MSALPDPRTLGKVAVLMGGTSAEREISLQSGTAVLQALRGGGVDAHAFDPAAQPLEALRAQRFARCFIALHGRQGEDGTVQGALELLGIPYTGSGVLASSLAMDKAMTKRLWRAHRLPTPRWRLAHSAEDTRRALHALGGPMIVKPAREGSTLGLSKITRPEEAEAAWQLAARMDERVLCEEFVTGLELTCALLEGPRQGAAQSVQALPLIHIVAPGGNYDYHNKYFGHATQYHCPSGLPAAREARIQRLCVRAWQALGCCGWARADIMLRAGDQQPLLLEINTSPGMTDHSLVPMAARAAGMDYASLCLRIAATARLENPQRPPV